MAVERWPAGGATLKCWRVAVQMEEKMEGKEEKTEEEKMEGLSRSHALTLFSLSVTLIPSLHSLKLTPCCSLLLRWRGGEDGGVTVVVQVEAAGGGVVGWVAWR